MNKKIAVTVFVLAAFAVVVGEIKFKPSQRTLAGDQMFSFVTQDPSNSDIIWAAGTGTFKASTGEKIWTNNSGSCAVDFDLARNSWNATDSGLLVVDKNANRITRYTTSDGLPSNSILIVKFYSDSNWIVAGSTGGVSITKLDANNKPIGWKNALSVSIHQFVIINGKVWAVNNEKIYCYNDGAWVPYDQFLPQSADVDGNGNLWASYTRIVGHNYENGLVMFDYQTQSWKEKISNFNDLENFGTIRIKGNILYFTARKSGVGKVNLADMTVERKMPGTLDWFPEGCSGALTITPDDEVLFTGRGCFVKVDDGTSVKYSIPPAKLVSVSANSRVVGDIVVNLLGQRIAVNSFSSAHSFPAGHYFILPAKKGNNGAEKFSIINR